MKADPFIFLWRRSRDLNAICYFCLIQEGEPSGLSKSAIGDCGSRCMFCHAGGYWLPLFMYPRPPHGIPRGFELKLLPQESPHRPMEIFPCDGEGHCRPLSEPCRHFPDGLLKLAFLTTQLTNPHSRARFASIMEYRNMSSKALPKPTRSGGKIDQGQFRQRHS